MAGTVEQIQATVREGRFNKNAARRVRVSGLVPAVVYGAGLDPVAVTVDPKAILRVLHSETGHNTIFDLAVAGATSGATTTKAMIVDWQNEPIKGKLLHIDMKRIAMDRAITVSVPVTLVGVPVGVKVGGGVLDQVLREVEVECLPGEIPNALEIDVTGLELDGAIHISDLPHSGKLKFLGQEDAVVAHVTTIKEEAIADAVATPEGTEPEVAKKGKGETPDAGAAGGKK